MYAMLSLHFAAFLVCIFNSLNGQELKHHLKADSNGTYHIYWEANTENITFELHVATKGYVGFGFTPNGGMTGADVIIGWVYPNGTSIFHDRHALGFYEPVIDNEQNYQLLNASENATHTMLKFTRKLNTCDKDDIIITDDTMKIIFSWHPEDPENITGLPPHGPNRRGTQNTYLLNARGSKVAVTDDIFVWEVFMPNISIPAQLTTYWCFTFELPKLDGPHEYVGFDVQVKQGHEQLLHHLQIMQCVGNTTYFEELAKNTAGYECVTDGTVIAPIECQPAIILWAIGTQGSKLPDNVGIPMGEENGGARFYFIQVHYNNMEEKAGYVDDSKVIIYLSNKPRPIKGGTWQLYANFDYTLLIPPQQQSFPVSSYCPEECTRDALPDNGISVYAIGMHAHLTGKNITLRHFRNNKELEPIAADYHYDFSYQQTRQLAKPVTVMPGDLLMGQCDYNTMDRNETVVGGYGIYGEMCFIYIFYYPATPLSVCIGGPAYKIVQNYFGAEEMEQDQLHIKSPPSLLNKTMIEVMKQYNWNNAGADKLKQMYKMQYDGVKEINCINGWIGQNKIKTINFAFPSNASLYKPLDTCAVSTTPDAKYVYNKPPYYAKTYGKD